MILVNSHRSDSPDYVVVVSIHKAGTNLVANLLCAIGYTPVGQGIGSSYSLLAEKWVSSGRAFESFLDYPDDLTEFIMAEYPRGTAVFVHKLRDTAPVVEELRRKEIPMIFNYRDPRDVLVSEIHYLINTPPPFARLQIESQRLRAFTTMEERIFHCLANWPHYFEEAFWAHCWLLDDPKVCKVCYEELVGQKGNGDDEIQCRAVDRVLGLLRQCGDSAKVAAQLYDEGVRTYRQGRIGGWRQEFSNAARTDFLHKHSGLLSRYRYDQG